MRWANLTIGASETGSGDRRPSAARSSDSSALSMIVPP
jgi:hypothetical protein